MGEYHRVFTPTLRQRARARGLASVELVAYALVAAFWLTLVVVLLGRLA